MKARFKRPLIILRSGIAVLAAAFITIFAVSVYREIHLTPKQNFDSLFSDMSIGAPEYESIQEITHPLDAIKGDYFILDFTQSEPQLHRLAAKLVASDPHNAEMGITEAKIMSSNNFWFKVASKIDPDAPWHIQVRAVPNATNGTYIVHMEGLQPDNLGEQGTGPAQK